MYSIFHGEAHTDMYDLRCPQWAFVYAKSPHPQIDISEYKHATAYTHAISMFIKTRIPNFKIWFLVPKTQKYNTTSSHAKVCQSSIASTAEYSKIFTGTESD